MEGDTESWLRAVLGKTNKEADAIVLKLLDELGYDKEQIEAFDDSKLVKLGFRESDIKRLRVRRNDESAVMRSPTPVSHANVSVTNHGPVGSQTLNGGTISTGTLTQNVTTVSSFSMPKEAGDAFKRRQEMACSESMILFSEPSFLASLLAASHSTISLFSELYSSVYGSGFVIAGGYVATAMHNICPGTDYKRELLKSVNNDKWRTEVVLSAQQKETAERWREQFAKDVHLFVDYSSKSDLELKMEELQENRLHFDPSHILLFPHHDVMLIKISSPNCPPPLKLLYPELSIATGDNGPQSRCFLIGHPSIKLEDRAERNLNMAKVISMQRDNFIWRENRQFSTVEYFTDTLPGFSGGPVLIWRNGTLFVIAVHFSGIDAPRAKALAAEVKKDLLGYNEGSLLSATLNKLKEERHPAFQEIMNQNS